MSEIPEDVMKAASDCYDGLPIVYDGWNEDDVRHCIAMAILAERERCIAIVADAAEYEGSDFGIIDKITNPVNESPPS